ncbi:MAG: hypothetical protein WCF84_11050 [Anaerolineae bacterium]
MKIFLLLGLLLIACSVAGCGSSALGAPTLAAVAPTATPTPTVAPTNTPATPSITLNPTSGGARTWVTVAGRGFPGGAHIRLHLGSAGTGASNSYAEAIADPTGRVTLALLMPGEWPDGSPITDSPLMVVAATLDSSVQATAPFSYQPAGTPAAAGTGTSIGVPVTGLDAKTFQTINEIVNGFLTAVQRDSTGKSSLPYLDADLQARSQKGQRVLSLLGIQKVYPSFQITAIEPGDQDNSAVARVTLQFTPPLQRVLLLTQQGSDWKIADIAADQ